MSTTPIMTLRFSRQIELVFRDTNPAVFAFQVGVADTLDNAFAGTHSMFQIPRLGTYRSHTIRQKRLGRNQESLRGLARAYYDPQDFWTTVSATANVLVGAVLAAGDTITIDAVVLTGVAIARTPGADDFQANLAGPTLVAAEIAAAINDPLNGFTAICTANPVGPRVYLQAVDTGAIGNTLTLASVTVPPGNTTVSGALFTGGYTMPADSAISFLRVSEVMADGSVMPEGPILVIPPPAWCTSPRPVLTLQGTAPNVAAQLNGLPPLGSMHVVLPRFSDNMEITNLDGGNDLKLSVGLGLPEITVPHGTTVTLYDAVSSDLFIRGSGGTVAFDIHAAMVQGEMA